MGVLSSYVCIRKTYAIQDIYLYDELTSAKHSWKNTNLTSNQSYSSNGMTVTGNSNGAILVLDETLPSTYSAEVTITALSPSSNNASKGGGVGLESTFIQPLTSSCYIMQIGSPNNWFETQPTFSVGDTLKLINDGSKVEYYKGTTKIGEIAIPSPNNHKGFGIRNLKIGNGTSDSITIKDLKIKSL